MAKIILEPFETFEHFHNVESTTTLINGAARCKVGGEYNILELQKPLIIPANQSHMIENIGSTPCVLECGHGNGGNG